MGPLSLLRDDRVGASGQATTSDFAARSSRRDALRRSSGVAVAVAAGLGLGRVRHATAAPAAPSAAQDRQILNFALLLEYLQEDFYSDAVKRGALTGEVRHFAEVVREHERAHVAYLQKALGPRARQRPAFAFGEKTQHERSFVDAAVVLENVGVVAYNGQAANLTKPVLAAAAEIVSVEGRHAAWISDLAGRTPAPRAADVGISAAEALRTLRSAGLLKTR